MKVVVLFCALIATCSAVGASPKSESINQAKEIFQTNPFTFFCEKPIDEDNTIYARFCDTCPIEATKVKWMDIIPNKRLAQGRLCYTEPLCINTTGKRYKGIGCCRKIDNLFVEMESDLHNIVPEEPLLSRLNNKSIIGEVAGTKGQYICDLRYNYKAKTIQPPPHSRGMLARTYLYYESAYGLVLEPEEKQLFLQWHYEFPPTEWEKERNTQIYALTNHLNLWVHG